MIIPLNLGMQVTYANTHYLTCQLIAGYYKAIFSTANSLKCAQQSSKAIQDSMKAIIDFNGNTSFKA